MPTKEIWYRCDTCIAIYESKYLAKECEKKHKRLQKMKEENEQKITF